MMFSWLTANILMKFSATIIICLRARSHSLEVQNPVLIALMLDTRRVINSSDFGICDAWARNKDHDQTYVMLEMSHSQGRDKPRLWRYPRPVPKEGAKSFEGMRILYQLILAMDSKLMLLKFTTVLGVVHGLVCALMLPRHGLPVTRESWSWSDS